MRLKQIEGERRKLLSLYKKELQRVKKKCTHSLVVECSYRPEGVFNYAEGPKRVCEACGLMEDGWGGGFKLLKDARIKTVTRDEAYHIKNNPTGEL